MLPFSAHRCLTKFMQMCGSMGAEQRRNLAGRAGAGFRCSCRRRDRPAEISSPGLISPNEALLVLVCTPKGVERVCCVAGLHDEFPKAKSNKLGCDFRPAPMALAGGPQRQPGRKVAQTNRLGAGASKMPHFCFGAKETRSQIAAFHA